MRHLRWMTVVVLLVGSAAKASAADWPQFRGPAGRGVADGAALPGVLSESIVWRRDLAKGHSSPVVVGKRLFLTALAEQKLATLCLDANTGNEIWRDAAPFEKLESVHRIGSPATATVVSDGERVYSFFGSSGMSAYTVDGQLAWRNRMGPFNNSFGACSSPVLLGEYVISIQDHDTGSFLAAYRRTDGELAWRVERPNMRRNYSTPVIWETGGEPQIVIAGTAHLRSYRPDDGTLLWQLRGLCRVVSNTPVVGEDGALYVASTGGGSAPPQPDFDTLIVERDSNKNGRLEAKELPNSPIKSFLDQFDRDGNGGLDQTEYESIRQVFAMAKSEALAVRPGGSGDITESHVRWRDGGKSTPRNASPLFYRGRIYLIKDGGILTVLDAQTGELVKRVRVRGGGKFYSSPVAGDGKLFICSDRGNATVFDVSQAEPQLLSQMQLQGDIYATPALVNGRVYIRTSSHLYCFGR